MVNLSNNTMESYNVISSHTITTTGTAASEEPHKVSEFSAETYRNMAEGLAAGKQLGNAETLGTLELWGQHVLFRPGKQLKAALRNALEDRGRI
jgi:hypothetical protein